ncbi:hypothetical protein H9L39_01753 [Fusarium oxysporum f. sp. albedinis]|nr:hypothetical protein H9L39_01753 [Fusarium oxysporum f. sp. albedinis]
MSLILHFEYYCDYHCNGTSALDHIIAERLDIGSITRLRCHRNPVFLPKVRVSLIEEPTVGTVPGLIAR